MKNRTARALSLAIAALPLLAGCPDGGGNGNGHVHEGQRLYVAHEGSLVSYDAETGEELPGTVLSVNGPVDLQATEDGFLLVNLTAVHQVLVVDGRTMLEEARITSSTGAGLRPVHSYITPAIGGKQYWVALNDGQGNDPATNTALFVDILEGSPTRWQVAGEVGLGVGHHKAAFSRSSPRAVISNIADCDDVLSVYDFTNPASIAPLATFTASDGGWTHPDPGAGNFDPLFCDPTFQRGLPPAPHGCATAANGKAYCNLTSNGAMVVVDLEAATPSFSMVTTSGAGGGYTAVHPEGRYVYTMQETPREGAEGATCQAGQVVVIDSQTDTVVKQLPVHYKGPSCTETLTGTAAETAYPGHVQFANGGSRAYLAAAGGFGLATARVDQVLVLDTSDPANPVQMASIQVGESTSHAADTLSGDGEHYFVVGNVDGTVTRISTVDGTTTTFAVESLPKTIATWGEHEGPSHWSGHYD